MLLGVLSRLGIFIRDWGRGHISGGGGKGSRG
jgi:hypothetical protein